MGNTKLKPKRYGSLPNLKKTLLKTLTNAEMATNPWGHVGWLHSRPTNHPSLRKSWSVALRGSRVVCLCARQREDEDAGNYVFSSVARRRRREGEEIAAVGRKLPKNDVGEVLLFAALRYYWNRRGIAGGERGKTKGSCSGETHGTGGRKVRWTKG